MIIAAQVRLNGKKCHYNNLAAPLSFPHPHELSANTKTKSKNTNQTEDKWKEDNAKKEEESVICVDIWFFFPLSPSYQSNVNRTHQVDEVALCFQLICDVVCLRSQIHLRLFAFIIAVSFRFVDKVLSSRTLYCDFSNRPHTTHIQPLKISTAAHCLRKWTQWIQHCNSVGSAAEQRHFYLLIKLMQCRFSHLATIPRNVASITDYCMLSSFVCTLNRLNILRWNVAVAWMRKNPCTHTDTVARQMSCHDDDTSK